MCWVGNLPTPVVTGSFIITGKPGFPKAEGVCQYIHQWCNNVAWNALYEEWFKKPPLLEEMYFWITGEGLGSFMKGQIIADLKYLPFMREVDDWWTWATPGPGSMKGLNIVLERDMNAPWAKGE